MSEGYVITIQNPENKFIQLTVNTGNNPVWKPCSSTKPSNQTTTFTQGCLLYLLEKILVQNMG